MKCNAQYNAMHLFLRTISLIKTFNAMQCAIQRDVQYNAIRGTIQGICESQPLPPFGSNFCY